MMTLISSPLSTASNASLLRLSGKTFVISCFRFTALRASRSIAFGKHGEVYRVIPAVSYPPFRWRELTLNVQLLVRNRQRWEAVRLVMPQPDGEVRRAHGRERDAEHASVLSARGLDNTLEAFAIDSGLLQILRRVPLSRLAASYLMSPIGVSSCSSPPFACPSDG